VIGTARGGITDYVRDGETGWLVRDVTPAGLADTMAAAVADPRRMAEMSRAIVAARDSLTRSFDAHVDEIETVYRELRPRTAATGSAMRSASSQ
jgi:glycosyltransferase involved in cell wall biosynthesis